MRAPISVVIPTLNAAAYLPKTLGSLGEGLEAGLIREVVITDGGSKDETRQISDTAGAVWVSGPPGRGGQLRRGADEAAGEWLLFLHSDTCLAPGWSGCTLDHIRSGAERAAYFKLSFDTRGLAPSMVSAWANLRSRLFGLPYGDQGLLISRELYQSVGGFRDFPLMEDVEIARALRSRLDMLNIHAITSAERYQKMGWLRRGTRNLATLIRYFLGADPETLARFYRR